MIMNIQTFRMHAQLRKKIITKSLYLKGNKKTQKIYILASDTTKLRAN